MDTLMLIVTVLSLGMAVAMAIVALKLLREERLRSDARVAALAQMSADPDAADLRRGAAGPRTFDIELADLNVDTLAHQRESMAGGGGRDLFSEREPTSPWSRRLLVISGIALLAVAVATAAALSRRSTPAPATAPASAAATEPAPLELLSLRHEQTPQGLAITGLVQNPASGRSATRVIATAFAFAPDGTFLASGRAPLDVAVLEPGDQSPFVVTVPATAVVGRYRVGFRAEDGRVLPHMDRRPAESLARR